MLAHIGNACRNARVAAGLRQIDIATAAGVSHATVSRFETGRTWPHDEDALIQAYATETGIDARVLWRTALDAWEAASRG